MQRPRLSYELDTLILAAQSGRLDRRSFIHGALTLGATLPVAATLWSNVAAATPRKGGVFRVGLDDGNTTDSMDPATYNSRFMITMAHTHTNFLTEIAENEVVGELAGSWEASPDAKKWTLKLRRR